MPKLTDMLKVLAMALLLVEIGICPTLAADQTADERLKSFMKVNNIKDVDWYSPLEIAKGGHAKPLPVASDAEQTIDYNALQQAIDYVDKRGSVALLIWQGGKLQLAHYGAGFGLTTRTDPASMHKSVMTILYGAALRDGFIKSIEEPAAHYLTEWANDGRSQITIHNLMNMASGLEYSTATSPPAAPVMQLMLGSDIAAATLAHQSIDPPGTEFSYNNANSEALGIILQRAVHMRYADYLSKTLLQPMGTGDGRVWLDHEGGMAHTFCCLQITGEDWLRIGLLLKNGGKVGSKQVIPAAWIQQMIIPSALNPNYGLQLWLANPYVPVRTYRKNLPNKVLASAPFVADDMFFFDGAVGQRVYVSRKEDLVIVRTGDNAPDWDDSFIPNVIARGLKAKSK